MFHKLLVPEPPEDETSLVTSRDLFLLHLETLKVGIPQIAILFFVFFAPGVFIGGPVSPLLGFYSVFNYSIHFNTWMQGWEFAYRFSEQIACFLQKNEQMSDSLKNERFAHFLIFGERPARISHVCKATLPNPRKKLIFLY